MYIGQLISADDDTAENCPKEIGSLEILNQGEREYEAHKSSECCNGTALCGGSAYCISACHRAADCKCCSNNRKSVHLVGCAG